MRSNETVENWSIYPPKETGEIHYLDPKYIENAPMIITISGGELNEEKQLITGATTDKTSDELIKEYDRYPYYPHFYVKFDIDGMPNYIHEVKNIDIIKDSFCADAIFISNFNNRYQGAVSIHFEISGTDCSFEIEVGSRSIINNRIYEVKEYNGDLVHIFKHDEITKSFQYYYNDVELCANPAIFYNGNLYSLETAIFDEKKKITESYFSTTANGIYRRLKVTPGETEDSNDIITIDKEIELAYLDNAMSRETIASGTIKDGATKNLDYYSRQAFIYLCNGTRNAYLTLSGDGVESEYELEPGGFYDGLYYLNYNGKNALRYSIRSTNASISFVGDIGDIIDNNSKITGYKLSADQLNYSVIPRNVLEVDGTTIKLNDKGQLTLALSNANGVSF